MLLDLRRSVLVLVDHQTRLMPVIHQGPEVLRAAAFLGRLARTLGVPTWATLQNPRLLGAVVPELSGLADHRLDKVHFSAVADGLLDSVRQWAPQADQLVLAGCETHVCLLQTALDVQKSGLQAFVVPQASGSRRPSDKAVALKRLGQAGVTLVSPEMVAFEWLGACTHPDFKAVLTDIKAQPLD